MSLFNGPRDPATGLLPEDLSCFSGLREIQERYAQGDDSRRRTWFADGAGFQGSVFNSLARTLGCDLLRESVPAEEVKGLDRRMVLWMIARRRRGRNDGWWGSGDEEMTETARLVGGDSQVLSEQDLEEFSHFLSVCAEEGFELEGSF